jgi:hypothetical protein
MTYRILLLAFVAFLVAPLTGCDATFADPTLDEPSEQTVVTGSVTVAGALVSGVVTISGRTRFGGVESFEAAFSQGSYRVEGLFSPSSCGSVTILLSAQEGGLVIVEEQRLLLECGSHVVDFVFN